MKVKNGFGIEITSNYHNNFLLFVERNNNSHKLWITLEELTHLRDCLNTKFKEMGLE